MFRRHLTEKEAKKQQEEWAAKLKLPVEATNKIGMKMILIPPAGAALPKAYYLGKYEVTQGEWEKVMGYNPSGFGPKNAKVAGMDTSKFPVEMVSWFDSVEFCNKLSEREGLKPYYDLKVTKRGGKDGKQIEEAEVKILGGAAITSRRMRNGSMAAGRGRRRSTTLATRTRTCRSMRGSTTTAKVERMRWGRRSRMRLACMICMGTFGSGMRRC